MSVCLSSSIVLYLLQYSYMFMLSFARSFFNPEYEVLMSELNLHMVFQFTKLMLREDSARM